MMALEDKEQVFLLGGMRFKLDFSPEACDECGASDGYNTAVRPLDQYADELQGKWIALVPAENDRHLELVKLKEQRDELSGALRQMTRAYVRLVETGRDLLVMQGYDCDPVEKMEADDPNLIAARAAIAKATGDAE